LTFPLYRRPPPNSRTCPVGCHEQ